MTVLQKTTNVILLPGAPAVPGDPGVPARPAYCAMEPRTVTVPAGYIVLPNGTPVPPGSLGADQSTSGGTSSATVIITPARTVSYQTEVCYPATQGRPPLAGQPAKPSQTLKDFNLGWNAGAVSRQVVQGNGTLSFKCGPGTVGAFCGLNAGGNEGSGYKEITFALYCARGIAVVYEQGVRRDAAVTITGASTLSIKRVGSTITYAKDGEVFHTSSSTSSGALFADASLYSGGDRIIDAKLTADGTQPDPAGINNHGSSEGAFLPVEGWAANVLQFGGGHGVSAAALPSLRSAARLLFPGESPSAPVEPGEIPAGPADPGDLAPSYAVSAGSFAYLLGSGISLTGGLGNTSASFRALQGMASDRPYASSSASLAPLEGLAIEAAKYDAILTAKLQDPYRVRSSATQQRRNQLNARMPMARVQSAAGAQLRAKMPSAVASGAGTVAVVAGITARMGSPVVVFSATTGAVGKLAAALTGHFTVRASSGAALAARLTGRYRLAATGLSGTTGKLTARMPSCQASMAAHQEAAQRITARMPMLRRSASARLTARMAPCRAYAWATSATPWVYEAYSVNLSHRNPEANDETTRYTNFAFSHIVRYQGNYFGVAADGLYRLEGATDDGQAIAYALKTGTDDFDAPQLKTVASAYFGGRLGPGATVTLHAGELGAESYAYTTPRGQAAQNHREKFGRGVKSRYFALGLAGEDALALDSIEFETNTMKRRV